jgi:hypothetical protein
MLKSSTQSGAHPHAVRGADLYETPAVAVQALLRAEPLPHCIWEPATGRGAIVRELRAAGHTVIASDLHDYGFPLHFAGDFLLQTHTPVGCECILTNPPFLVINEFIEHALDLSPRVIVLARLALLESVRRTEIIEHRGLARVHVFRDRLPMMHRDGWAGRKASSAIPYAWFVWERDHRGPFIADRISHNTKTGKGRPGSSRPNRSMNTMTKAHIISESDAPLDESNTVADPFDLTKLRLDQSFVESAGVKKLLTTVPVRKPSPQDFVRVHPSPEFRAALAVIELKEDREIYLLTPQIARELPGEFMMVMMFTTINRQGVVHLWPARLPAPDGRIMEWHRSALDAADMATRRWVRVRSNMSLGAYEIIEAATTAEPEWPAVPFQELLRIAFRDRLVDRLDHAVIKRLRGE